MIVSGDNMITKRRGKKYFCSIFLLTLSISELFMMYNSFVEELCVIIRSQVYVSCFIYYLVAMGQLQLVSYNTASDNLSCLVACVALFSPTTFRTSCI